MTPLTRPSWPIFSEEFHCPGCGGHEAYRSRPRGFFEAYLLPILFLRPVRCDRCYLRSYVLRSVPARERAPRERVQPHSQLETPANQNSRIA